MSAAPSAQNSEPSSVPRWKTTAELVRDEKTRADVDAIARAGVLDEKAFDKVRAGAAAADLVALLDHESAAVRAQAAHHVARFTPSKIELLVPLLDDAAEIPAEGRAPVRVGAFALDALCASKLREAGLLLVRLSSEPRSYARDPLGCAVDVAPDAAAELAEKKLGDSSSPRERTRMLSVLAVVPRTSACKLVRQAAANEAAEVREAAASALALCADSDSTGLLEQLSTSSDRAVAREALTSLVLNPSASPSHRRALLDDRAVVNDAFLRLPRILQSAEGVRVLAPIVKELLLKWRDPMVDPLTRIFVSPETTTMVRELAAESPTVNENEWSPRKAAVQYLSSVRDRESLPLFRSGLASDDRYEVLACLKALGELGDTSARAEVEKLTTSKSKEIASAAEKTLAKLRAK